MNSSLGLTYSGTVVANSVEIVTDSNGPHIEITGIQPNLTDHNQVLDITVTGLATDNTTVISDSCLLVLKPKESAFLEITMNATGSSGSYVAQAPIYSFELADSENDGVKVITGDTSVYIEGRITGGTYYSTTSPTGVTCYYNVGDLTSFDIVAYIPDPSGRRNIDQIRFPIGFTSIPDESCNRLPITVVYIPNTITSIGDEAFYACHNLQSVNAPNASAGTESFRYCDGMTSAVVKCAGNASFNNCTSLTGVTVSSGHIGEEAFYNCTGLTSVNIDGVSSIGDRAFYGLNSLTTLVIPDSVTGITSDSAGYGTVRGNSNLDLTIGSGITSLEGPYLFVDYTLDHLTIPDSVQTISNTPFDCEITGRLTIGSGVTSISGAITKNTNPTVITISAPTPPTITGKLPAGGYSSYTDLYGKPVFVPCGSLSTYRQSWSEYYTPVQIQPFGCELVAFLDDTVKVTGPANAAPLTASTSDVSSFNVSGITTTATNLYSFPEINASGYSISLTGLTPNLTTTPQYVTVYGYGNGINSGNRVSDSCVVELVPLGDTSRRLTYIQTQSADTYTACPDIYDGVSSDSGSNYVYILNGNYYGYTPGQPKTSSSSNYPLECWFTLPSTASTISIDFGITKSVVVPEGVTGVTMSSYKTAANSALETLVLPSTVKTAPAFTGQQSIKTVDLGGVETLPVSAFRNCSGLTSIDISNVTDIPEYAFTNCVNLTAVTGCENIVTIYGNNPFGGCTNITSFGNLLSVQNIPGGFLAGCNLQEITLGPDLTFIGRDAFYGLPKVTLLATTPPEIYQYAFSHDSTLKTQIYVPASAVDTYKSAAVWRNYSDSIFAIPE